MASRRAEIRKIEALLEHLEPRVRSAFIDAVYSARRSIDLRALEDALRARDVARAVELLRANQAFLFPLDAALTGAYFAGGAMVAEAAAGAGVVLGFEGRHVRAELWAREHVGRLIREIVEDQAVAVRSAIEAQIAASRSPRSSALEIAGRLNRVTGRREGGLVGLTTSQSQAVLRMRLELEALDPAYFDRKLRDRRHDSTVRRAIREGRALSAADRDRITARYSDRILKHRADSIAQTETMTAIRAGRREGYQQAIDQGLIAPDRIKRAWDATMDGRTREDHRAMHGTKTTGMGDPWVLPDGSRMMFPGDGSMGAPASQTVRCRCFERFEVDWLSGPMR